MILDAFPFFNEVDLLELRLRVLDGLVDRHVLVQSEETHSGRPKPLTFKIDDPRWAPWREKIVPVVVPRMPEAKDFWVRENAARHAMNPAIRELEPDDLVIVSDVDEMPDPEVVRDMMPALTPLAWVGFRVPTFYYYLNLQVRKPFRCIALARADTAQRTGAQGLRNGRHSPPIGPITGGWHFSYQGGVEAIRAKLAAFAHGEYNTPFYTDPAHIRARIAAKRDLLTDKRSPFTVVPLSALPAEVQQHPERYAHLLYREGGDA